MRSKGYKRIEGFKPRFDNSRYKVIVNDNRIEISSILKGPLILTSTTDKISRWNDIVDWENARYSYMSNAKRDWLIVVAPVAGASGLETNFHKYLIVNLNDVEFYIGQSLSDNNLFFMLMPIH